MKSTGHASRSDKAVSIFKEGFNCSQAVVSSFAEDFGVDKNAALKIAAGFGGGMGRMAQTCGAVTGAYMVIGLKHGAITGQDKAAKEHTYQVVRDFNDKFKALNQSLTCKELLKCDISTPEGLDEAKQKGLLTTTCPKMVRDAVEILEEMMRQ
jgi:C_GCAxxG_C_C family probable redox protein